MSLQRSMDTCVDPLAMRTHLQPLLAPRGAIDAVRVLKARRSASRERHPHPLTVLYEVELRDTPRALPRTQWCHGMVCRDPVAFDRSSSDGPGAMRVDALDLRLWSWPDDPALPQLRRLLDPQVTRPYGFGDATKVEAIRYEPGRRASLRYTHADGRTLWAKTFDNDRGAALHRRFAWFWERAARDPSAPTVAQPIAYDQANRCLWQASASGIPLRQCLEGDVDSGATSHAPTPSSWTTALAHAVNDLHDAPLELIGSRRHDLAHWLAEIERRRNKIARVVPELEARANELAANLGHVASMLPSRALSLIHGDMHLDQAWLDGGRVVLFDFDEFTLGDPMEDLAELIVKLPTDAKGNNAGQRIAKAYAQRAGHPRFDAAWFAWHQAVQQLLQASRAFVFQIADWPAQVARRLGYAEVQARAAREAAVSQGARP